MKLKWSPPSPPSEECERRHTRAETPFGSFLLTWKSWEDCRSWEDCAEFYFDETPWGEVVYDSWGSLERAQAWGEAEFNRRVRECL